MEQLTDFSDVRNKGACIHCGAGLVPGYVNRDHVPSKTLLSRPLPDNLPVSPTCMTCNASFARDEEYVSVFLAAVLTGSADPDASRFPRAAASARHNAGLRERIVRARQERASGAGQSQVVWDPEVGRVHRVILKNARGHSFYESGEVTSSPPSRVWCCPLDLLTTDQRDSFERGPSGRGWPEVGSRMMQRIAEASTLPGGWVAVQAGVYRYAVGWGPTTVRTVIREYLATEVAWT